VLGIEQLASAEDARRAFAEPIPTAGEVPDDLRPLANAVSSWDEATRELWTTLEARSVYGRIVGLGVAIADAIRLQRAIRTRRIDRWLAAADSDEAATFEAWRSAFFVRCDAMGALATEGLIACDLAMAEDGVVAMALRNPRRIAAMVNDRPSLRATLSVVLGVGRLVAREWEFFESLFVRQLRRSGVPLSVRRAKQILRRLNDKAGRTLLTHRHVDPLLSVYEALEERGIRADDADAVVLVAIQRADETSGKPWKGLFRLYELIMNSGAHPREADWNDAFREVLTDPIVYTHVPGREWIVRDYTLGKRLMQVDGRIDEGDQQAGLQQGRGSLATGYIRGGHVRVEFGRRYSKPLAAFLDSMVVAEGTDHQRQRKAFLPFFTQAAVLEHAEFVEETVCGLLENAENVAKRQDGHFDVRHDFSYRFPIRVICHVLELPPADVARVQHWSEAAVRAMDSDAGVSFEIAKAGQQASDAFREYLSRKLADARTGAFQGRVIRGIADNPTLSEEERVANLGVIIFAGFETTTGLITKGVEALCRHPDQWQHLRSRLVDPAPVRVEGAIIPDREWRWLAWATTQSVRVVDVARRDRLVSLCQNSNDLAKRYEAIRDQELVLDQAIEELLRWTAPGSVVPLTASKEVRVPLESSHIVKGCPHAAGAMLTIQRGETINVAVDELNRACPVGAGRFAGSDPRRLDVTRAENSAHLSFGLRHSCIGAFLAKENAKRALEGLLRRFPDLELAGDPIPQEMELFSGLASLPVQSRRLQGTDGAGAR
jgi:cytochrome P450